MGLKRKITFIVVLLLLVLYLGNCRLVSYGIEQGIGQVRIVRNARNINEMMKDSAVSDSIKQKLRLVDEIKKFAIDSLGLNPSKNYNTFYDQQGEPILWIAVGCKPYKMEPYLWKFPVVGKVPYKGFFKKSKAIEEAKKIEKEGFDARVGTVSAWSTLGFFKDPILSDMLDQSEGQIARLIIHELTHSTIYVKGNAQFSENLATFIGDEGSKYYMLSKYGKNAKEYLEYLGELNDNDKFSNHILIGARQLDSLYKTFGPEMAENQKKELKNSFILKIMKDLDTINFYIPTKFPKLQDPKFLPNNAFFISYITYNTEQDNLTKDFINKFNSDFKKYLNFLKKTYESV
ncbi:MAG: aminopeptidase [Bacteroidales bacterium]